jgi:hypothetical protein
MSVADCGFGMQKIIKENRNEAREILLISVDNDFKHVLFWGGGERAGCYE